MITTIFFDAGNTLLKAHPSVAHLYAQTAQRFGADPPPGELMTAFKALRSEMPSMAKSVRSGQGEGMSITMEKAWWKSFVCELFNRVGGVDDFDTFFEELYDVFARSESWRLYPDVLEILKILRAKSFTLYVLSNWDSRLADICKNLGLSAYFNEIIISSLIGFEKPDPEIYRFALKQAGVNPENSLHIGDDLELDFQPARSLGMHSLLLDRFDRYEPQPYRITSLSEVLPFLGVTG